MTRITWHNAQTNPPAVGKPVLVGYRCDPIENEGRDREASEAILLERGVYKFGDGHEIPAGDVYVWAEIPVPPAPEWLLIQPTGVPVASFCLGVDLASTPNQPGDDAIVS